MGALQRFPHLLLTLMVRTHGEGHKLVERHAVLSIDIEQLLRDGGELEPLLHHLDAHEERGCDLLLAHALLTQCEESAKLVEGMERRSLDVLGEGIFLGETFGADNAGDWRGPREALLLHEELQRAIAPPAGRNLEHASLSAISVDDRTHSETLEKRSPRDVLRELVNRDARLDLADIGLT